MKVLFRAKTGTHFFFLFLVFAFICIFSAQAFSQAKKSNAKKNAKKTVANLPKVTQIDEVKLKELLKPNGKPLLINFWATWCDPCREEFPDLVKINADYKEKIDFITISLDDLAEIRREVPKFLAEMKADMASYLLKAANEDAAIALVSKDWQGALPLTVLFNEKGETAYLRQGIIKPEILRAELDKLLTPTITQTTVLELPKRKLRSTEEGRTDAKNDIANGQLKIKRYGLTPGISQDSLKMLKAKYGLEVVENGCILLNETEDYFAAYNEIMKAEIVKRFGDKVLKEIP